MKKFLLLAVFSGAIFAHPIEQIVPVADDLGANQVKIDACHQVITDKSLTTECNYLAKATADVLTILVQTLEAENIPVHKDNRKKILGVAWDHLSFWEFTSIVTFGLGNGDILDVIDTISKEHPEAILKHLTPEMIQKLTDGEIIENQ